jgi:hypothetical protein
MNSIQTLGNAKIIGNSLSVGTAVITANSFVPDTGGDESSAVAQGSGESSSEAEQDGEGMGVSSVNGFSGFDIGGASNAYSGAPVGDLYSLPTGGRGGGFSFTEGGGNGLAMGGNNTGEANGNAKGTGFGKFTSFTPFGLAEGKGSATTDSEGGGETEFGTSKFDGYGDADANGYASAYLPGVGAIFPDFP